MSGHWYTFLSVLLKNREEQYKGVKMFIRRGQYEFIACVFPLVTSYAYMKMNIRTIRTKKWINLWRILFDYNHWYIMALYIIWTYLISSAADMKQMSCIDSIKGCCSYSLFFVSSGGLETIRKERKLSTTEKAISMFIWKMCLHQFLLHASY